MIKVLPQVHAGEAPGRLMRHAVSGLFLLATC